MSIPAGFATVGATLADGAYRDVAPKDKQPPPATGKDSNTSGDQQSTAGSQNTTGTGSGNETKTSGE